MRNTVHSYIGTSIVLICALSIAALITPIQVKAATGAQICTTSQSCAVGEFLYDDSYTPLSGAACTLTARNPDGTLFLDGQALTGTTDGWYAHQFTAPSTVGIYRSQICCTAGSDYLCIDKSFEVKQAQLSGGDVANAVWNEPRSSHTANGSFGQALQQLVPSANDIAAAVWGYSGRTLSDFGTLVADMWSYSTRSLTTFGTLVADIWSNSTRRLTGANLDSGTLATATDVTNSTTSIKGTSNKSNTDLSNELATLQTDTTSIKTTVTQTKTTVDSIYTATQAIQADIATLITKWGTLSAADIATQIDSVGTKLGTSTDADTVSTVFGKVAAIRNKWGTQTAQTLFDQAVLATNTITSVQTELGYNGKTTTAYQDLQQALSYVDSLETSVGTATDTAAAATLFGRMKSIQEKVDALASVQTKVDSLLGKWSNLDITDIYDEVSALRKDVLALNVVSNSTSILNETITNNTTILNLKNEVLSMKALMEINRSLIERVANKPVVATFLIEGSVVFKTVVTNPSQTETQEVLVTYYLPKEVKKDDIMKYDDGIKIIYDTQKELLYAQGTFTLAPGETRTFVIEVEDIWKITSEELASLAKQAGELGRPLEKTAYFAQGVTLKSDIDVALDKIQLLQEQATTPDGRISAYRESKAELAGVHTKMEKLKELVTQAGSTGTLFGFVGATQTLAVWGLIIIMSAGFIFLTLYMRKIGFSEKEKKPQPAPQHVPVHLNPKLIVIAVSVALVYGVMIAVASVRVTQYLAHNQQVLAQEKNIQERVLGKNSEPKQTQCAPSKPETKPLEKVTVTQTPTGWLRVRAAPSGREIARVDAGDTFERVDQANGWTQIKLPDGSTGWVTSQFVTVK